MPKPQSNTNEQSVVNTAEVAEVPIKQADGKYKIEKTKTFFTNLKITNNGKLFNKDFPTEIPYAQLVLIKQQKPKIQLDDKTMNNKGSYYINESKTKVYTKDKDGNKLAEPWKQAFYYPRVINSLDFVL